MPNAAKTFRLHDTPKQTGRVLGKQDYGPAWRRFRAAYVESVIPICVLCNVTLPIPCGLSLVTSY